MPLHCKGHHTVYPAVRLDPSPTLFPLACAAQLGGRRGQTPGTRVVKKTLYSSKRERTAVPNLSSDNQSVLQLVFFSLPSTSHPYPCSSHLKGKMRGLGETLKLCNLLRDRRKLLLTLDNQLYVFYNCPIPKWDLSNMPLPSPSPCSHGPIAA